MHNWPHSGVRTKAIGHISLYRNTCYLHYPSYYSGCSSVPSGVSSGLDTVASILVVLAAGKLLGILLLVVERYICGDRHTQIRATSTHPIANLWIKKSSIIKEFQLSHTCNFTVWHCFSRNIRHIKFWAELRIFMNFLPSFHTTKINFMHSPYTPLCVHPAICFRIDGDWITLL